jgi:hypothetical protein
MRQSAASVPAAPERLIQERYRFERELARGAMGAVYEVFDIAAQRRVALKRALSRERRELGMFEREYHTLLGLKHPRIIEVYDFGIDARGPYYTMELLPGRDLRELAPLTYRTACGYLRDVASSLGLLHARRFLHRDLSPRNVRVSDSGRCKLLDFGALSGFGVPDLVVGTPPFIPPESLHRLALDQRSDLFALGAVAYSVLTGSYAFPARTLADLSYAWRRSPQLPSEALARLANPALPAIPAELDDLVMSLLTLDPLGRPSSAAEVIDRLNEIGELPPDEEAEQASRSYLVGVPTVGRTREQRLLRERLSRALVGSSTHLLLETRAGLGSTRLVSELAVEAQLAGALPLVLDARAHREPFGSVHGLVDKLLTVAREDALAAVSGEDAPLLARFSPALARALAVAPDTTDWSATPTELRRRITCAVVAWLDALSRRRPLLIAIDDAQALDDASAACFTGFANDPGGSRLLVVVIKTEQLDGAPPSVHALAHTATRVRLGPLGRDDVDMLVRSWFGDAQHATGLADVLHRVSGGNVRACSELAEHLVRTEVVRDIQGAWVLPQQLDAGELPASAGALPAIRLRGLGDPERRLLEALAVHRGALPLARCLELAQREAVIDPYAALERLVQENVLHHRGNAYEISYAPLREAVLATLAPERKRELHRSIGRLIADAEDGDVMSRIDAGWHLLHGGDAERGAALLAEAGLSLGYSSDDLAAAAPALRAALQVYRTGTHSDYDRVRLLGQLALSSVFADRHLGEEFGEEAMDTFERVLGLTRYQRWRRVLGRTPALLLSIAWAALCYAVRPGSGGFRGFQMLVVQFIASATSLCATAAVCLDEAGAKKAADRMEPLRLLGKDRGAAHAHHFARLLANVPKGPLAPIIAEARVLLARLDDPRPIPLMPPSERTVLTAGVLELFCVDPETPAIAERLEHTGMFQDRATADQLRLSYHALRGEAKLADIYRRRAELNALQGGTFWLFEVWSPSFFILVYTTTRDMIGLKHVAEQLDRLAQDVPTLGPDSVLVMSEYHHMKGDHETAFALAWPILMGTPPHQFLAREHALSMQCGALNRLGRHAEAKAMLEPLIAGFSEADRRVVALCVNSYREYAVALAGLGEVARAFVVIDENLSRYAHSAQPLVLGNLHATATAVALTAGDSARAELHVREMERWFRSTENPVLIAQCEKLLRRVRELPGAAPSGRELLPLQSEPAPMTVDLKSALSRLTQLQAASDRAELALQLLLDHVQARAGFLFENARGAPRLIAPLHGEEPPPALLERVQGELATTIADEVRTLALRAPSRPADGSTSAAQYIVHVLADGARTLGALAVLPLEGQMLRTPRPGFLQAIAAATLQTFDSSGPTVMSESLPASFD